MLALTTLDRGDSVSLSAVEKSRRELAMRHCLARGVASGGQEVRRLVVLGKESRLLGIGLGVLGKAA